MLLFMQIYQVYKKMAVEKNSRKKIESIEGSMSGIEKLNANIEKQISFKRNFLLSLVKGVGYAIGAAVVAGVLIAVLNLFIHGIQDIPVIGKVFSDPQVQGLFGGNK